MSITAAFRHDPFAPGLLSRLGAPPRRVVLLRASRIGDFICATPALRALRARLPQAEITLITLPLLRDLAVRLTTIDRVVAFPGYPGIAEQFFEARRAARFFLGQQQEGYDLAIQLQGTGVYSNPFTLMLGARYTAGFVRPGDGPGRLDAALAFPEHGHEIERVLALADFVGAPPQGLATDYPLRPEDHAAAAELLRGAPPPLIGLHPTARDLTRQWPVERFLTAGARMRDRHGGTLVLVGEAQDREATETAARQAAVPALNLMGKTSLPVLGGVIARLQVLVTNDTGPAHIAYALGTPAVVVVGGSDPARYGPPSGSPHRLVWHDVPCRPCEHAVCPIGNLCLEQVSVDEVAAAAAALLPAGG